MIIDKIIQALKESEFFLSGELLSQRLKMSRSAVWKHIEECRQLGYVIEAVPHSGYKLVKVPDKLYARELTYRLGTSCVGREIVYKKEVASTMDTAMRLALEGAREGMVVCAEAQTHGKGRQGRQWVSPKAKGIYCSVILRPALSPTALTPLTLVAAVAVCEALRQAVNLPVQIKWPNDLMYEGKKVGGILTELNADMDAVRFVVIGLGVNVNTAKNLLPVTATSLKEELGYGCDRIELARALLRALDRWYQIFQQEGFAPALERWRALSATLGQRVTVTDAHGGRVEGMAEDVDEHGGLLVRRDGGQIVKRFSGDVCPL